MSSIFYIFDKFNCIAVKSVADDIFCLLKMCLETKNACYFCGNGVNVCRGGKARLGAKTLLSGNELFKEFKGALTEQYVMQESACVEELKVCYYTNERSSCEIDFVIDNGEAVSPVEVKAEINLRAKSLKSFCERFKPALAFRASMADFKVGEVVDIPLYAVSELKEYMDNVL